MGDASGESAATEPVVMVAGVVNIDVSNEAEDVLLWLLARLAGLIGFSRDHAAIETGRKCRIAMQMVATLIASHQILTTHRMALAFALEIIDANLASTAKEGEHGDEALVLQGAASFLGDVLDQLGPADAGPIGLGDTINA